MTPAPLGSNPSKPSLTTWFQAMPNPKPTVALTNFPAAAGAGGTFLDVTWAFIKFFDDYPDARGGNEFLTLIFNLHAMTKDLASLGLPTEAGRDDEAEVKEE